MLVTVVDYDRVGASEPIGKVLLGCDQKGPEGRHWTEMLASPRRPVAQWHTLKDIESKLRNFWVFDVSVANYTTFLVLVKEQVKVVMYFY